MQGGHLGTKARKELATHPFVPDSQRVSQTKSRVIWSSNRELLAVRGRGDSTHAASSNRELA